MASTAYETENRHAARDRKIEWSEREGTRACVCVGGGGGVGVCGPHSIVMYSVLRSAQSRFYPRVQRSPKKGCEQSREM